MLRTLEPQKLPENKNAEADFKNSCSYKMKSVYQRCCSDEISSSFFFSEFA